MRSRIDLLLFTTFLVLSSASGAWASDTQVLRIGTQILPPYGAIDEQGNKWGIIYELNQEIGKRSGMAFTNELYPYARMVAMLANGELDVISSQPHDMALAAGDKLAVQFVIDVIAGTRKGGCVKTLEDFRGCDVVYHQGAAYPELDPLVRTIYRSSDYGNMLQMLLVRDSLSGAVFSEPAYYYFLQKQGLSPEDFGKPIVVSPDRKQWVFVRKDMPEEMRKRLAAAVDEIFAEGMYRRRLEELKKGGVHQ